MQGQGLGSVSTQPFIEIPAFNWKAVLPNNFSDKNTYQKTVYFLVKIKHNSLDSQDCTFPTFSELGRDGFVIKAEPKVNCCYTLIKYQRLI